MRTSKWAHSPKAIVTTIKGNGLNLAETGDYLFQNAKFCGYIFSGSKILQSKYSQELERERIFPILASLL